MTDRPSKMDEFLERRAKGQIRDAYADHVRVLDAKQRRERLRSRIVNYLIRFSLWLGFGHPQAPDPFLRGGGADRIDWQVGFELGFWDRVRFLISGRLNLHVIIKTEHVMGEKAYNFELGVKAPRFLDPDSKK